MILRINREIVSEDDKPMLWFCCGRDGISFDNIDEALSYMEADDPTIELYMNSLGGDCDEGFAIYDRLRASGKEIKATIQGKCASMASVILLAASERTAYPHASVMIHRPFLSFTTDHFDLNDAEKCRKRLEDLNERIISIYEERTGTPRDVLQPLIDAETEMDAERAKELGFIHDILTPASASAYTTHLQTIKNSNSMKKEKASASVVANILKALGLTANEVKALDIAVPTTEGQELEIETESIDTIEVGDTASPDGTFTLEDGRSITIEGGVVTKIGEKEPEEEEPTAEQRLKEKDDKIAELKREIESLKADNADLQQYKSNAKSSDDIAALDFVKSKGGLEALKKMASGYTPAPRGAQDMNTNPEGKSLMQQEIERRASARKANK